MARPIELASRRTNVDSVFDYLKQEIISLRMLPGTKISEAEIAKRFGLSRQPVRDAFTRLENIDLLLIRPQKATEVRRFSTMEITRARFIRAALEAEVLRRAARMWDDDDKIRIKSNLEQQESAAAKNNTSRFNKLDHEFHRILCVAGRAEFVIDTIAENKSKVDRLCMLSIAADVEEVEQQRMREILRDHDEIVERVLERDEEGAAAVGMRHLSRLDGTIEKLRENYEEYFED